MSVEAALAAVAWNETRRVIAAAAHFRPIDGSHKME